ncbi:ATP-binding protein [Methanobrevibacter sp.]|uniref:ATP-binding protein n=1 Tax=Methanobrevibacter sp. TaxID=66852 RepID=UPI00388CFE72
MVKREIYMKKISKLIDNELIKVITGVRRCGKSYMLKLIREELIKRGINKNNIILINFEDPSFNNVENTRELDLLVKELVHDLEGKIYLFFDEIQNVDQWEKSINGYKIIYDCDIYITGSNSNLLSGELATHLTGRYIEIKMKPFSFNEYLEFNEENNIPTSSFEEYLKFGGMPIVLSLDEDYKLEYLKDLFNSIFTKDIVNRHNIRDFGLLSRLVTFILDNVGKTFSAQSIVEYLEQYNITICRKTIYNYLKYLEEACFIYKLQRMDLEGKNILKLEEKYYVVDHGFCQAMVGRNEKNIGIILENIVFIELLRRDWDVKIGKIDNFEIDFACRKFDKTIYIQVTYSLSHEETREREFRPLLKVQDNFPKYVISYYDNVDFSRDGIIHLNLVDFLKDYSLIE